MASSDYKPTVVPAAEFDAEKDADELKEAFEGFGFSVFRIGTKDDVIVSIFTERNLDQRNKIQDVYYNKFETQLVDDLHSELSGNYLQVIESFLDHPDVLCAKYLNNLLKPLVTVPGFKNNDVAILEVIYPMTKQDVDIVMLVYESIFKKSLIDDVDANADGPFKDTVLRLLKIGRQKNEPDPAKIQADVNTLTELSVEQWSPYSYDLMQIFLSHSTYIFYLLTVFQASKTKSLEEVVKNDTKKEFREGFLVMISAGNRIGRYMADQFFKAIKGLGTDDDKLIYLLLSRCEVDLKNIEEIFQKTYQQSLQSFIRNDTSGNFQKVLLAICSPEDPDKSC